MAASASFANTTSTTQTQNSKFGVSSATRCVQPSKFFGAFQRLCQQTETALEPFYASVLVLPLLLLLLPCRLSLGYWIWLSYVYTVYIYCIINVVVCCHVNSGYEDPGSDEGQGALVLFEKLCLSFAQALL